MKKQLISFLLIFSLLTIPVTAAEIVNLDLAMGSISISQDAEGNTLYSQGETVIAGGNVCVVRQSGNGTATSNSITVVDGTVNMTIAQLNIETTVNDTAPISVKSGATLELNLVGANTVSAAAMDSAAGVQVSQGSSVAISGPGFLYAAGGHAGAGIGGKGYQGTGAVTINSGTITAVGGDYGGAGIGGGCSSYVSSNESTGDCYLVHIKGGMVTATGNGGGSGIGGGERGDGGVVFIEGGIVTATANRSLVSNWAAGIGGGYKGSGGIVSISNASVYVHGIGHAIGGGGAENTYGCHSITLGENAVVNASFTYVNAQGATYQEQIHDLALPSSAAALSGHSIILTTNATSASGVTYQWQMLSPNGYNWNNISNATQATLRAIIAEENDESYYRCKITNGFGNVAYTDGTQGHVLAFDQQPQSAKLVGNNMVVLAVTASCSNVTYQWERSYDGGATWEMVPGEIYSTLFVGADQIEHTTLYRCVITATNGDQLRSDAAVISVGSEAPKGETVPMYRMYNPNTGEHFYTGSTVERDNLASHGWHYEGVAFHFYAGDPTPVHRIFDPATGEHLYTMNENEINLLFANGWQYENVAFNSASADQAPQYRLHNPNATVGAYHFTNSEAERNNLIAAGWEYQGIGWYSLLA